MKAILEHLKPVSLLVLRVSFGVHMIALHGWGKLTNAERFINGGGVQQFPFPAVSGWIAILGESLAAVLLAVGLFTRAGALLMLGTMLGAAFVVHGSDPWGDKELALLYATVAFFFLAQGGGKYSLDAVIFGKKAR